MARFATLLLAGLLAQAAVSAPAVDPDRLLTHIRHLSADEFRGRGNGSEELERAADYVAAQFAAAGLQPGVARGWSQPFELTAGLAIGTDNHLVISNGKQAVRLTIAESYYPLAASPKDSVLDGATVLQDVPIVFAGFGLSAPSHDYDDYSGLDVKGKAVLIFSHEPQERDRRSRLNGVRPMPQTTLEAKAAAASSRGARALLVLADPAHRVDEADYRLFGLDPDAENVGIPVLRLRRTEMQPLIDAWGLEAVAREIDKDLVPRSRLLPGASADYSEHLALNRRTVRNVVGVLPGRDPQLAHEAIVIGAHYDHVGIGGRFSTVPERTGEIHNGADDNASGTAAIIEIARTAVQSRERFARSLVFIAFAGEERGLLGSAHYVRNPSIPIDRTIAMLNLDMVGRARGSVDVSGITADWLEEDFQAAVAATRDLRIRRGGPGAGRSDDSSFIDGKVPAINFFTGFHDDYHRPTDDWEKVDVVGTAQVARLAYEFAARLASRIRDP
jgi:hypothetical protein